MKGVRTSKDGFILKSDYKKIPKGTILRCISGELVKKGTHRINMDTRFGCIAYKFSKAKYT